MVNWIKSSIDNILFNDNGEFIVKTDFYINNDKLYATYYVDITELFIDIKYPIIIKGNYRDLIFTIDNIEIDKENIQLYLDGKEISLKELNSLLGKNLAVNSFYYKFAIADKNKIMNDIKRIVESNISETEIPNDIICYRSIGDAELESLKSGKVIKSKYPLSSEPLSTGFSDNVICFFRDRISWKDKDHKWLITAKLNNNQIDHGGTGTYFVPEIFNKTKVWSGRRGNNKVDLSEIYAISYNMDNVINIEEI